ncbi:hypothetical protein ACIBQX_06485 [Nonomuraea sp. NPDC049714]|uniref:hypothetical protein n=1 Tax=Nonomuraea sp. NPDC049714 TaxID=3364357 RepID=UPI0037B56A0D
MPAKNTPPRTLPLRSFRRLAFLSFCVFTIIVGLTGFGVLEIDPWFSLGSGLAALLTMSFALAGWVTQEAIRLRRQLKYARDEPSQQLRHRVEAVNTAITEAADLMDELRRDVEAQQAAREALLAEAERQQRLLELNKDEAEKIRQILVGETKATIRAAWRRELAIFFAGVLISGALSIPIGIWVNSIS